MDGKQSDVQRLTAQQFRKLPRGRIFFHGKSAYIKLSYRQDKEVSNAEELASGKALRFSPEILVTPH